MKKWIIAGGIILVMLLLCVGMAVVAFTAFRFGFSSISHFSARAEATETQTVQLKEPISLDVLSSMGDVTVRTGPASEISFEAHKIAYGLTQAEAEEELKIITISAVESNGRFTIRAERAKGTSSNNPWSVDFIVTVPQDTLVTAVSNHGNVNLTGTTGEASLDSNFGNVTASGITGAVTAHSDNGDVYLTDIKAGDKNISATSRFGKISLEKVTCQELETKSDNGDVVMKDVEAGGKVLMDSNFGSLRWENGKGEALSATSRNGSLTFINVKLQKDLTATSDFGDVNLTRVGTLLLTVHSKNGSITIEEVTGVVNAQSDFGDIHINGGKDVSLTAISRNGGITYAGSLANGPHTVTSDFGNITLSLPAESALNIDLKTDFGSIKTDFQVTLASGSDLDKEHIIGSINGGGETLKAYSKDGSLKLETQP
ncbi:MAG TPA: DUF4097 family beta strand repeat-containing protein [Anaerolineaceae bacterium]|nr:DUF4097 family beta strand repeat-containing protein [Anaerolineaceae bacterium]HPN52090.1 DUF4097 family beta strand repeat-containing protein [Anaerolineaceae bacterium]